MYTDSLTHSLTHSLTTHFPPGDCRITQRARGGSHDLSTSAREPYDPAGDRSKVQRGQQTIEQHQARKHCQSIRRPNLSKITKGLFIIQIIGDVHE